MADGCGVPATVVAQVDEGIDIRAMLPVQSVEMSVSADGIARAGALFIVP